MATVKEKDKQAWERYLSHLQELRSITSQLPKGTDAEREARIERARFI